MGMGVVSQEEFDNEVENCLSRPRINHDAPASLVIDTPESQINQSDETLEEEVIELGNEMSSDSNGVIKESRAHGRNKGDNNVPNSMRKMLGLTSEIEGRAEALELAAMFDISASSVSAYANGSTSTKSYNEPKKDIIKFITSRKNRITKKALHRIAHAIDQISDEKLNDLDAKELATVSKDLSSVVKHMEPESKIAGDGTSRPQFVVYAPQITQENHYEQIQVNE